MVNKIYKILTKDTFMEAAIEGEKMGFNRTLSALGLDETLPDDVVYPIIEVKIHGHIAGKPVEPHYRTTIVLHNTNTMTMDMTIKTYDGLPEVGVDHP